jgi:hypothetical protein
VAVLHPWLDLALALIEFEKRSRLTLGLADPRLRDFTGTSLGLCRAYSVQGAKSRGPRDLNAGPGVWGGGEASEGLKKFTKVRLNFYF